MVVSRSYPTVVDRYTKCITAKRFCPSSKTDLTMDFSRWTVRINALPTPAVDASGTDAQLRTDR